MEGKEQESGKLNQHQHPPHLSEKDCVQVSGAGKFILVASAVPLV